MINTETYKYDLSYPFLQGRIEDQHNPLKRIRGAIRSFMDFYLSLSLTPGRTVLDVGCSISDVGHHLNSFGLRTIGIDLNFDAIRAGSTIFHNTRGLQAYGEVLPFLDRSFDAVISQDFFEHLPTEANAHLALEEMTRVCKGDVMVHKVTVLEDKEWIDADSSHRIKKSAAWWLDFFAGYGWITPRPTWQLYLDFHPLRPVGIMRGYFLLYRDSSNCFGDFRTGIVDSNYTLLHRGV